MKQPCLSGAVGTKRDSCFLKFGTKPRLESLCYTVIKQSWTHAGAVFDQRGPGGLSLRLRWLDHEAETLRRGTQASIHDFSAQLGFFLPS